MVKPKAVIKKYGDRRLYDSTASRYVKLEDIARMVREGIEVEVLDARTGKDVTRVILTQIVVEDARDRETGLPMQMLRQLVMASDRATHDFLSWYLNGALDVYRKAQDKVQSGVAEAKSAVTSPLDFLRQFIPGQGAGAPKETSEVEELRRRLEEMEARLAAAAAPARSRRRTPPAAASSGRKRKSKPKSAE